MSKLEVFRKEAEQDPKVIEQAKMLNDSKENVTDLETASMVANPTSLIPRMQSHEEWSKKYLKDEYKPSYNTVVEYVEVGNPEELAEHYFPNKGLMVPFIDDPRTMEDKRATQPDIIFVRKVDYIVYLSVMVIGRPVQESDVELFCNKINHLRNSNVIGEHLLCPMSSIELASGMAIVDASGPKDLGPERHILFFYPSSKIHPTFLTQNTHSLFVNEGSLSTNVIGWTEEAKEWYKNHPEHGQLNWI
jgi:hypothetical protein